MRTAPRIVVVGIIVALLSLGLIGSAPVAAAGGGGGGGCHRDATTGPVEGAGVQVDLVDFCMSPSVLWVDPGATVTFTNRDEALHNLYGSGMYVGELRSQQSVAFRFDDAGTYAYACTFHPGMVGAIAVGDGRRIAPLTRTIAPIEVQAVSSSSVTSTTTTTALAALPTAATSPADDGELPMVPMAAVLAAVALAAYLAGRRARLT